MNICFNYVRVNQAGGRYIRERNSWLIVIIVKYEVHLKLEQVGGDKSGLNNLA